jgi:hypothetical protein
VGVTSAGTLLNSQDGGRIPVKLGSDNKMVVDERGRIVGLLNLKEEWNNNGSGSNTGSNPKLIMKDTSLNYNSEGL